VCLNNQNASPLVVSLATDAQEFQLPLLTALAEYGSASYNAELHLVPVAIVTGVVPLGVE
jgi:hypothetical protein